MVIASLVQQLLQFYNTVEAEAMAASRAIELSLEVGLQRVALEGDSEVVVTALDRRFWISSLWVVIRGC